MQIIGTCKGDDAELIVVINFNQTSTVSLNKLIAICSENNQNILNFNSVTDLFPILLWRWWK